VPAVRTGNLVFLSGSGPIDGDRIIRGKVGDTIDLETAVEAARLAGLQLLGALRATVGSLDRVTRIVKVFGMVNGAPGFNQTPTVIDGCSNLLLDVFGEAGRHARSAVGQAELPFDIAVEIEMVVEVSDG
jgi:enamine deaminase RidA (YjgF/YER057c/UK114 family)